MRIATIVIVPFLIAVASCSPLATKDSDLGDASNFETAVSTVDNKVETAAAEGNESCFQMRYNLEGPQIIRGCYLGHFTTIKSAKNSVEAEKEKTKTIGNADAIIVFTVDEKGYDIVKIFAIRGASQLFTDEGAPSPLETDRTT